MSKKTFKSAAQRNKVIAEKSKVLKDGTILYNLYKLQ